MITDIFIRPTRGQFDMDQIKGHLASIPHAALDPVGGKIYLLASNEEQLESALGARGANPKRFPYSVALVSATPVKIKVAFRNPQNVESARRFVQWLRTSYDVRISDEALQDITEQCDEGLQNIFGPSI